MQSCSALETSSENIKTLLNGSVQACNFHLCIWLALIHKATYIEFKVNILSVLTFPGNRSHDLGVASSTFYCLKAFLNEDTNNFFNQLSETENITLKINGTSSFNYN